MSKKIIAILFAVMLCVLSVVPAFAQSEMPRLVDDSDVFLISFVTDEPNTNSSAAPSDT